MLLFVIVTIGCGRPPADAALLGQFQKNRAAFQKLAEMIAVDQSVEKVHQAYIHGSSPGEKRLAEYRRLLRQVNCQSVTRWDHPDEYTVEVTAFAGGALPDDGIYKGFEFFPKGLPERSAGDVVSSLDGDPHRVEGGTRRYRKINENWYLTFLY